ncbi:FecR domain-containing protein [Caulobacter sp. BP25]|uniref:FecR family protein n=1 Tax=Caulobacter sp. BP25 TaxID=2048900 RepID=UPI000C12BC11|nr:FecR domain-containing protein [Caulobacter sp. BP25]PHY18125.1 iron dicitrate transport regulator FecR [Caulobacter sp. BP25]
MSRVRQQAALWAARRLDAEARDDAGFEAWKAADAKHAQAFDKIWRASQDPALAEAMRLSQQKRAVTRRAGPLAVLAGGLLACGLAVLVVWPQAQLMTVTPLVLQTPPGQHQVATLADGTQVTLDGATRLEVRLGVWRRQVELMSGQAFFDVAHDAGRPFTVKAPEGAARVLGTAFDLERADGRLELSVRRGRVRLAPTGLIHRTAELTMGQRAFAKEGRLSAVRAFDLQADDWRSGWLETDGVTLARLVERLNRASPTPIAIADPGLGRQRVAGRFRLDEPQALVRNLALMHGFTVRQTSDGLVLSR